MRTPVMKFGGSSVADAAAIGQLVGIVRSEIRRDRRPVVVVSAMAGVTDRLLALATAAAGGHDDTLTGLDELRARHDDTIAQIVQGDRAAALRDEVRAWFNEVRAVLAAMAIVREASPRALDGIAAVGELASSAIVAAALEGNGVPAVWVDARRTVVTDGRHTAAMPLAGPTREALAREVVPALESGLVPVIGGFVGGTDGGVTTTLGRGGSDYSAAVVGAGLHASLPGVDVEIQIWTDVDGMLTADPRVVGQPRVVSQLSFGEASELAYFGAKVLHPSTILPAVERNIPVRILNSRRPGSAGTLITGDVAERRHAIAAIACKRRITVIEVTSTRMLMAYGFLRRLFEIFERHATPVDVVTTSEVSVSVTVDDDRQLEAIVGGLREFAEVRVERDMALLCVVGDRLRADAALAVRLLGSLEGFPLRMVSQAASRRNLTVVLPEADLAAAMTRLHDVWFGEPASNVRASA